MTTLGLGPAGRGVGRILCLGAHADDIEIGCGATLLRLLAARPEARVRWVVLSADDRREEEARRGAALFAGEARAEVTVARFRDGFFPYQGAAIKEFFEALKEEPAPDLVLTHHGEDRHQDHRLVSELTWNTFRDHLVLEYEVPKYDGGLGSPNVFVPVDADTRARKIAYLLEAFGSQRSRRWFTAETFDALMRLRGVESAAPDGYAEAFHARKLVLSP